MSDKNQLIVNDQISISQDELKFTFARSQGPGGQNVNKVNTKAVLHWTVSTSTTLPEAVKQRLSTMFANKINQRGELVIASDRYREQSRNVADCLERLRQLILTAAVVPRRRRPTRLPRWSKETRLRNKRHRSETKRNRRRPDAD